MDTKLGGLRRLIFKLCFVDLVWTFEFLKLAGSVPVRYRKLLDVNSLINLNSMIIVTTTVYVLLHFVKGAVP